MEKQKTPKPSIMGSNREGFIVDDFKVGVLPAAVSTNQDDRSFRSKLIIRQPPHPPS